jgi:hypothetical protein
MWRFLLIGLLAWLPALALADQPDVPVANPPPPVDFKQLPWIDGEKLTYMVTWGACEAARGDFTVHKSKDGKWEFKLALASSAFVNKFYPFTGNFWSIVSPGPWRSLEYGEYRFEPKRTIKEINTIDYDQKLGTRDIWSEGKTKTFPVTADLDDVGSMLYHLRATPWKEGEKRTLIVYESNAEKEALVSYFGAQKRSFAGWPVQPMFAIQALPGKGTRRHGGLVLWMTDDARRVPIHAELDFRYGSFTIDLIKADPPLSAK